MTINLRPLLPADVDAVLAIAAASPEAPLWKSTHFALFAAGAPRPNPNLLRTGRVAVDSESAPILGFACATLLLDGQENRTELDTLAVLPAARRHGIGAALLGGILAWAAEHGSRQLALEVRASNAAALRFYTRLGFRQDGRRPRYYAVPEEDALLLSSMVTPASPSRRFSTEDPVEGGLPRC